MDYKKFVEEIVQQLREYYGKDADVSVKTILGNNGNHREGLVIKFTDEDTSLCPIIYLDILFEAYSDEGRDVDSCAGIIVQIRKDCEADDKIKGIAKSIIGWENVKEKVYPVLISVSKNEEYLKELVHTPFLDLAIVYEIRNEDEGCRMASAKVTHSLMNVYGISKSELHRQAIQNMEKDGYQMKDLLQLVQDYFCESDVSDIADELELETGKMYVLTNSKKQYGAACLLYAEFLEENLGNTTAFILPSSVHEVIVVPISSDIGAEQLNAMIQDVNEAHVDVCERLSDHYYIWDGQAKEVKMYT